jgi:hypothetical protein
MARSAVEKELECGQMQFGLSEGFSAVRPTATDEVMPCEVLIVRDLVDQFKPGFALIAQRAGVPVPVCYQVRLGRHFMVNGDARAFSAMLEAYFEDELRGSRPKGPDV